MRWTRLVALPFSLGPKQQTRLKHVDRAHLNIFRSLWGIESRPLAELLSHLKTLGYTGIEASLVDLGYPRTHKKNAQLLKDLDMLAIVGIYSSWQDYTGPWEYKSVTDHLKQWEHQLNVAINEIGAYHVNSHSGSDTFSHSQAEEFFHRATEIQDNFSANNPKIPIVSHETHRGRCLYHPTITLEILRKFPNLRLTLDVSHWAIVTERLEEGGWFGTVPGSPEEQNNWTEILSRVNHIHARIGSQQSPQLSAPTFHQRKIYYDLWKKCWTLGIENRAGKHPIFFSATPEYGPFPYFSASTTASTTTTITTSTTTIKTTTTTETTNISNLLWELVEAEKKLLLEQWDKFRNS